ncbi:MAG: hypothetical protein AB1502_07855 [Thermodesulfobacteriota bacterium]
MEKHLKTGFLLLVVLSLPLGFFVEHEHAIFFWHQIPSVEALFGGFGALLLILVIKLLASFASKKEDFYD